MAMNKISKKEFLTRLGQVKTAVSVRDNVVYSSIEVEGNKCSGSREYPHEGFIIYVDKLYQAYCELETINTTSLRKYIKTRAQSPALAILIEMGLVDC